MITGQELFDRISDYHPRCFQCCKPAYTVRVIDLYSEGNVIQATYECACQPGEKQVEKFSYGRHRESFNLQEELPFVFIPNWRFAEALSNLHLLNCPVCNGQFDSCEFQTSEADGKMHTFFYRVQCHGQDVIRHVTVDPEWGFQQKAKVFKQSICDPFKVVRTFIGGTLANPLNRTGNFSIDERNGFRWDTSLQEERDAIHQSLTEEVVRQRYRNVSEVQELAEINRSLENNPYHSSDHMRRLAEAARAGLISVDSYLQILNRDLRIPHEELGTGPKNPSDFLAEFNRAINVDLPAVYDEVIVLPPDSIKNDALETAGNVEDIPVIEQATKPKRKVHFFETDEG